MTAVGNIVTSPCITTIDLKEIAAASTPKENTP